MASKPKRSRKSGGGALDQAVAAQLAGLEGADAESAALIQALLVQDQLEASSPYLDNYDGFDEPDPPQRAGARRPRKTEQNMDEEMDDDFIPASVARELKLRGIGSTGSKRGRKRKEPAEAIVVAAAPAAPVASTHEPPVNKTSSEIKKEIESTSSAPQDAETAAPLPKKQKLEGAVIPSETEISTSSHQVPPQSESQPAPPPAAAPKPAAPAPAKEAKEPKEKDPRFKDGKWTAEEERLFLESLELYGRDWEGVSNHLTTRDKNAIRSHAQKYFIKLYKERKPLPAKVVESGAGYTLSGKPLDPDSAAAKQYLGKSFFKKREQNYVNGIPDEPPPWENFNGERDSPLPAKTPEQLLFSSQPPAPAKEKSDGTPKKSPKEKKIKSKKSADEVDSNAMEGVTLIDASIGAVPPPNGTDASTTTGAENPTTLAGPAPAAAPTEKVHWKKAGRKPQKEKKKPFRESDLGVDVGQLLYGASTETFGVKGRLRDRVAISWKQLPGSDQDRDPLTLIKPAKYTSDSAQPFRLRVHSNVLLVADLHAHLARVEIIGFLAGNWDPSTSTITISAAYPCKSLATGEDEVNVEMDPESELEIRKEIEKNNLRVVGWYHSHPNFPPHPSIRDIENQNAYQKLFVDSAARKEPFVGAIFGTYDSRMPTSESIVAWFNVDSVESKGQPYTLVQEVVQDAQVTSEVRGALEKLIAFYATFNDRTHFNERWKFNLSEEQRQLLISQQQAAQQAAKITAAAAVAASSSSVESENNEKSEDAATKPASEEANNKPAAPAEEETPAPAPVAPTAPAVDAAALAALAQASQITRLQKMLQSIRKRLPEAMPEEQAAAFIEEIRKNIESCWFTAPISKGEKHHC